MYVDLYHICDGCNKEFKVASIDHSQNNPIAKSQCVHCGKWNDIWIRVKVEMEKEKDILFDEKYLMGKTRAMGSRPHRRETYPLRKTVRKRE